MLSPKRMIKRPYKIRSRTGRIARIALIGGLAGTAMSQDYNLAIQRAAATYQPTFFHKKGLKKLERYINAPGPKVALQTIREIEKYIAELEKRKKIAVKNFVPRIEEEQVTLRSLLNIVKRLSNANEYSKRKQAEFKKFMDANAKKFDFKKKANAWEEGGLILVDHGQFRAISLKDPVDEKIRAWMMQLEKGDWSQAPKWIPEIIAMQFELKERLKKASEHPRVIKNVENSIREMQNVKKFAEAFEHRPNEIPEATKKKNTEILQMILEEVGANRYHLPWTFLELPDNYFDERSDIRLFAVFHTHPGGLPPTQIDRKNTLATGPGVVFSLTSDRITVYLMREGNGVIAHTYFY